MYRAGPVARHLATLALLFLVLVPNGAAQALDAVSNPSDDRAAAPGEAWETVEPADAVTPLVVAPAEPVGFTPFGEAPAPLAAPSPASSPAFVGGDPLQILMLAAAIALVAYTLYVASEMETSTGDGGYYDDDDFLPGNS